MNNHDLNQHSSPSGAFTGLDVFSTAMTYLNTLGVDAKNIHKSSSLILSAIGSLVNETREQNDKIKSLIKKLSDLEEDLSRIRAERNALKAHISNLNQEPDNDHMSALGLPAMILTDNALEKKPSKSLKKDRQ